MAQTILSNNEIIAYDTINFRIPVSEKRRNLQLYKSIRVTQQKRSIPSRIHPTRKIFYFINIY